MYFFSHMADQGFGAEGIYHNLLIPTTPHAQYILFHRNLMEFLALYGHFTHQQILVRSLVPCLLEFQEDHTFVRSNSCHIAAQAAKRGNFLDIPQKFDVRKNILILDSSGVQTYLTCFLLLLLLKYFVVFRRFSCWKFCSNIFRYYSVFLVTSTSFHFSSGRAGRLIITLLSFPLFGLRIFQITNSHHKRQSFYTFSKLMQLDQFKHYPQCPLSALNRGLSVLKLQKSSLLDPDTCRKYSPQTTNHSLAWLAVSPLLRETQVSHYYVRMGSPVIRLYKQLLYQLVSATDAQKGLWGQLLPTSLHIRTTSQLFVVGGRKTPIHGKK